MDSAPASDDIVPAFYVGHHESLRSLPVTDHVLRQAQEFNYDMLTTPITTPYYHTRVLTLLSSHVSALAQQEDSSMSSNSSTLLEIPSPLLSPLTSLDTYLTPNESISQLLAAVSPWIDLASPDPLVADVSRQVFNQEVAYAAFCGFGNVIVQGPSHHFGSLSTARLSQYARSIQEALSLGPYLRVHILLPMTEIPRADGADQDGILAPFARAQYLNSSGKLRESRPDLFGTWDLWNVVRTIMVNYIPALALPRQLPSTSIQDHWFAEPLRILVLPETSFLRNAKDYPVLSGPHQLLISRYMRLRHPPWLLLSDVGPIPGFEQAANSGLHAKSAFSPGGAEEALHGANSPSPTPAEAPRYSQKPGKKWRDPSPHLSYIRHLQRNQPAKSAIERFGAGYQDYLQAPLQPLTDNLESITYEVFEKDPVKYDWYERAISLALSDWVSQNKPASGPNGKIVLAVVGAGRGPLLTRTLRAADEANIDVDVWAVEKNANAFVLLQRHNMDIWNQRVTVVKSDMRSWLGPVLPVSTNSVPSMNDIHQNFGYVDILISELLGSFGDNELSPECLDGVQHVLNPGFGISVPSSYSAHLTPISSPKLYADIAGRTTTDQDAWQTPYVVMLHAHDYLSATTDEENTVRASMQLATAPANTLAKHTGGDQQPRVPIVKQAWEFKHPISPVILRQSQIRRGGGTASDATGGDGANAHNARFAHLKFDCRNRGLCLGLAGYFECVLYAGRTSGIDKEGSENKSRIVELSTNPVTMEWKSRDMISWFPVFFPLKTPFYVPANSTLQVSIWRQTDDRKVWYEWMVEAFCTLECGKDVRFGCSELHSSRTNGCLM